LPTVIRITGTRHALTPSAAWIHHRGDVPRGLSEEDRRSRVIVAQGECGAVPCGRVGEGEQPDRPLAAVRTDLEEGILVRLYLNRSLKQDIAAIRIYNPVTVENYRALRLQQGQPVRVRLRNGGLRV
jgi:hypothetical protein